MSITEEMTIDERRKYLFTMSNRYWKAESKNEKRPSYSRRNSSLSLSHHRQQPSQQIRRGLLAAAFSLTASGNRLPNSRVRCFGGTGEIGGQGSG